MSIGSRKGYELKTTFFRRHIRPFNFAIMLATGVISYNLFSNSLILHHAKLETGFCGCIYTAHLLGTIGIVSVVFLTIGWWTRREWFTEWGLLLALGVWLTRGVYVIMSDKAVGILNNPWASALLSLAWAIVAASAYALQRYDHFNGGDNE